MPSTKSSFLDKVLGRIERLDAEGVQTVVMRLERERRFLEHLFDVIQDGVLVLDESGRILYFNQAVTSLLNWPADKVEGEHISRFLPQLDWKTLSAVDAQGGRKGLRFELELTYPQARFLRIYAAPLDADAKGSLGLALVLHDATEARQQTFAEIESERIHSLTLLAASVAHEIGNPLNALHIHLQLMTRELAKLRQPAVSSRRGTASVERDARATAEKLEQYLGVAKGEISRLDYIVTQFLQAIRPSTPQFKMASLNDAARDTLDLLRPELENRGIHVKEKLARQLEFSRIDPGQIKQVLVNLIKNAMQAMTRGGTLTATTGQTTDAVWISVADTGGGIPQEQLNDVFKPFYTTKKKGTGLGLMIVERIVRQHGGRISVSSTVGQGTTFQIWLPTREPRPHLLEEHLHD